MQTSKDGHNHLIAFASKQLLAAEQNYTIIECECLVIVFSIKKYHHYLLMSQVVFILTIRPFDIWSTKSILVADWPDGSYYSQSSIARWNTSQARGI